MSLGWIGQIVAVAVLGSSGIEATGERNKLPDPIITQQTKFAIPFSVPATSRPDSAPVEVVLLLSRDSGKSWHPYGQVPPEQRYFVFQADGEGEYWFRIQSRDRAGNLWPKRSEVPGLRVRVDTTPPQVEVSAWRGESGQVTARWRIEDANLHPNDVALSYRTIGDTNWQEVALGRQHHSRSGETHLGEVTWWAHQGSRTVEVRVEAVDRASNRATATAKAVKPDAAPRDRSTEHPTRDASRPNKTPTTGSYGQPWPAQPHPPLANQYKPEEHAAGGRQPLLPPSPEQVRAVNSRLFELEFEVDSVDLAAISHVELWRTRDGGRTWRSISLHQHGRSPILAKADEEGLYGYRVVVHSRTGASPAPQPGDPPDVWIRVDLTKPLARIVSAKEGSGAEADHLVITWTAEDEELDEEPVRLAYSRQIGGPWTDIAKRLPNTGRHAWPLPAGEPGPFYLRLEVRDVAGNVGSFETNQPVVLDRAPPKVHIREVRPLSDSSSRPAPRRYIFR